MEKIVYTTGVFDILHPGHIDTLRKARKCGDRLIVGVQEDESVFLQKGKKTAMSCADRVAVLKSLPFVDECVTYSDIDQRKMLIKIKPNIMAQTEEWVVQTDRSLIIDFLKNNKIELVLLPIKKDISSSMIKKKVVDNEDLFRNDIGSIYGSLAIVPIEELLIYENFDLKRVGQLVEKIKTDNSFLNPITVAKYKGLQIVIDGVNRIEALKRLNLSNVFVQYVDYLDEKQVELTNNTHFLMMEGKSFIDLLDSGGFKFREVEGAELQKEINDPNSLAFFYVADQIYTLIGNQGDDLQLLNSFVDSYLGKFEVYRMSEFSQDERNFAIKVVFKKFTLDEVFDICQRGGKINSGITWHKVKKSITRFAVPLDILFSLDKKQLKSWLLAEIEKKIKNKDIRYYPSNIYLCDEWSKC